MKRAILAVLSGFLAAAPCHGRGGGSHGGGWGGGSRSGGAVIGSGWEGSSHRWGGRGGSSWRWSGRGHGSAVAPARNMAFTRNSAFTRGIISHQRFERVPNHYYFHNDGRFRYWHYFGHGLHWYGFFFGPRFFWLPFWADYWWWYDVNYSRWVFWHEGYWWWYGPGGTVYVDVNNNYVPYDQYQQQAQQQPASDEPLPQPPSAAPSPPPDTAISNVPAEKGGVWKSPDGARMVQIVGSNGQAFLYDESADPPSLMKTLATKDVENVRFSGGSPGKSLKILVDFKDGSFKLFDANGNPAEELKASSPAAPPPGR